MTTLFLKGLVLGFSIGSASWWLLLSGAVSLARSCFDERGLAWVNRLSGALITGFGVFALAGLRANAGGVR